MNVRFKAKPPPVIKPTKIPTQLNAAAVLREDSLYRAKQAQEAALIKCYESELRDSTDFYRWQTEERKKDELRKLELVDKRRKDMAASAQAALDAKEKVIQQNLKISSEMNKDLHMKREKVKQQKLDEIERKRLLVKRVAKVRNTAPKRAAAKLLAAKREFNAKDRLRQKEIAVYRREQREKEQAIRQDQIRQIRGMERTPKQRVSVFDPTTTAGVGLLEEVSLSELKERLAVNAAREKEEEQRRRDKIIAAKKAKQADLAKRMKNISRIRKSAALANKISRKKLKAKEEEERQEAIRKSEEQNAFISAKLYKLRMKRHDQQQRLDAEEARVAKQRMLLGNDAKLIERKHFEEQLLGAEREAIERQKLSQTKAKQQRHVLHADQKQRRRLKKKQQVIEKELRERRQQNIDEAAQYTKEVLFKEKKDKMISFKDAREDKKAALKAKDMRNLYAATANQKSIQRARDFLQGL